MAEAQGRGSQTDAELRDLTSADAKALLALNNASIPHVNSLEPDDLTAILDLADYARGLFEAEKLVGSLIGLWPGKDYASANYRWFNHHQCGFFYVDRVMIDGASRKGGYGRRLYADIERFALAGGARQIALEVNSQPPNPVSMRFHEALGFYPVGELANQDRSKAVVLMMKTLNARPD